MNADTPVDRVLLRADAVPASGPAWVTVTATLATAATVSTAAWLTARSLGWPLVHDGPLLHYVAARLRDGAVPYRDLFDMNFPGVYLLHRLGLAVFGGGDLGFRLFDLAVLGGIAAGLALSLASFGGLAAVLGAALFWLYHVAGGAWNAGQRDLLLCLPLAWATAAAVAHARSGGGLALGLAGLGLGAAAWIKPHALLLLLVPASLGWRGPRGRRARALAALGAGAILPGAGILAWLWASGGLGAFLDIASGYVVPLYSHVGRGERLAAMSLYLDRVGMLPLVGFVLWTVGGLGVLWRVARWDRRVAVLAAGVAYGALHFWGQGKGWEYHLYPLVLYGAAAGAAGLGAAVRADRRQAAVALTGVLVLLTATLAAKGVRNLDPEWIAVKQARAREVAASLSLLVAAGGTVQVFDTTEGGVHALYLLGARQPTRFLYDFHFYHDVEHPYVQRLRAELLADLGARPPAAVVLFERGWPSGGYERLRAFPGLAAWLEAGYRLTREGDGYRIYAARGDR